MNSKEYFQAFGMLWPSIPASKERTPDKMKKHYLDCAPDAQHAVALCKQRRVVVQAGGHCGAWPIWLSSRFQTVYTFEPDIHNFTCLAYNADKPNIYAMRAMLGEKAGMMKLQQHKNWIGAHYGKPEPGPVPVLRIDDMVLPCLDALILDVEGMELPALVGSLQTISTHHPVIMLEDLGHGATYGWGGYDKQSELLTHLGYKEHSRIHYDVIWVHNG